MSEDSPRDNGLDPEQQPDIPEGDPKPPTEPDLKFKYRDSKVEIYNLDQIRSEQGGQLYDRSDFGGVVQRVVFEEDKVIVGNDEAAQELKLEIDLDKFREKGSYDPIMSKLKSFYSSDFEVKNTRFNNVRYIATPTGLRLLAWYDPEINKVTLSNNLALYPQHDDPDPSIVEVTASPLDSIEDAQQLENFSKVGIALLDQINGHRLERTYKFGENITELPVKKDLGKTAMSKMDTVDSTEEQPSGDALGQLSDILQPDDERIDSTDIGGLEDVKQELRDIALSFSKTDVMEKWGAKRPQGVLFYGPPGTGKTLLAEALATEIGADMLKVQSSDIYVKWLGDSEEKVKQMFSAFRKLDKPTVVPFDEFDAIFGITDEPSPGGADNARNSVAGIAKQEMNTPTKENPNVLIVATTNHPERIDESLIRSGRFDHRLYIPMPDLEGRRLIASNLLTSILARQKEGEQLVMEGDIDIPKLAELTDGLSGADIVEVFRRVSLAKAMREARTGRADPISQKNIEDELQDFKVENI